MFLICTLTQSLFLGQKNSLVKNNIKIIRFSLFTLLFFNIIPFFLILKTAFVNKLSPVKLVIPTILKIFQHSSYNLYKYLLFLQNNSIRIAGTIRGFRTLKFAQKDGLLAAFFGLFLCQKCSKRSKKIAYF